MSGYLFTFRSVTPAQRGEGALRREGITVYLRRTPAAIADRGCGYALLVRSGDLYRTAQILRRQERSFERVYHQNGDVLEEVFL